MRPDIFRIFLRQIQRKTLILGITLKSQDKLRALQTLAQARVNRINQRGKIKSGLRLFRPTPGGLEKRITAGFSDKQFY